MKSKSFAFICLLALAISSLPVFGQPSSFSGKWKLNRTKTTLQNSQLFLAEIKILQKNDSLLTTRVYENGNGETYPFNENLPLDGKECKIVIFNMPRTAKATFSPSDGLINFESATIFSGNYGADTLKIMEMWKTEANGNMLTITSTTSYSAGTSMGIQYFDKTE